MAPDNFIPWAGNELSRHSESYTLDGSSLRLSDHAPKIFNGMTDVNAAVKNSAEYAEAVAQRLTRILPSAAEFAKEIKTHLDADPRFVIVNGLQFHTLSSDIRDAFILGFCSLIGNPTKTDKVEGKIIWDVTPREYLGHTNTTFSEHNGEAEFHTDSQFFPSPERYFSLWSLKHASDGGGMNGLVDARRITRNLISERLGAEMMEILFTTDLPFRVPTVFTEQRRDDIPEVLMAPIFAQTPYIRYRKDTLQKGMTVKDSSLEPQVSDAIEKLEKIIADQHLVLHHFLQSGQVLFANNHEILHNRTSFTDKTRHLLRVRMSER